MMAALCDIEWAPSPPIPHVCPGSRLHEQTSESHMAIDRGHCKRGQGLPVGLVRLVGSPPDEVPRQAGILATASGTDEHEHACRLMSVHGRTDAGEKIGIASVVHEAVEKPGVCRVPHGS